MHDHFAIFVFLELSHVIGDRIERLLAHPAHAWRRLKHIDDLVLQAFFHDMPHEPHVLYAADENVAVFACHNPIVLLARPIIRDF